MEAPQLNRKLAILGVLVTLLMLGLPMASAQQQTEQYQSLSGDPRYITDGQKCHDAVADKADTTCVVLYGHLFDLLNKVPINVQRPPDEADDLQRGFTGTPGYEPLWNFNQLPLESSPGFVEYNTDPPRLHPEKGLSSDVELATDVNIYGYWYLSADFDEFSPADIDKTPGSEDDQSIGAMPCLTVRMVLQTGRYFGRDGDVLAEGTTTKNIVTGKPFEAGQANPGVPATPCPGADGTADLAVDDVIEFEVDLGAAAGIIPQGKGFIVYVEWWTWAPGNPNNQDKVYQHQWNLRTGEEYVARVVVPIKNPIRVEKVKPIFFDGKIYVQGVVNSPWGSYDVDPGSVLMKVYDESGNLVTTNNIGSPILKYSVDHDGHFKPMNVTFPWDYQKDNIAPGTYTIELSARNWQWTGEATKTGTIFVAEDITKSRATDSDGETIEGDPTRLSNAEESPGFPVTALLFVALALVGAARLRRRP